MAEHVLTPCPKTPNCVSTLAPEDDREHRIEPISFEVEPEQAIAAVKAALAEIPRTKLVEDGGAYLHAVSTSKVFRFKDDLEVLVGDGRIDVRSAARLGKSDMGVNRRRAEAFTQDVESRLASSGS